MERALKLPQVTSLLKVDREPLLVVCAWSTASGKTALALAIARRFHGEIVIGDSVAMYREFEIGHGEAHGGGACRDSASFARLRRSARRRQRGRICAAGAAFRAKSLARRRAAETFAHRQRRHRTLSPGIARRTFCRATALREHRERLRARARNTGPSVRIVFCGGWRMRPEPHSP